MQRQKRRRKVKYIARDREGHDCVTLSERGAKDKKKLKCREEIRVKKKKLSRKYTRVKK